MTSIAKQLSEAFYEIGSGGLRKLGDSKVAIVKDRIYWLGGSSSPNMIIVTSVGDDRFSYRNHPFTGRDLSIEMPIGKDLIEKGSRTHLQMYGKHMDPADKKSLEDLLKGGKGKKANVKDFEPLKITAVAAKGHEGKDLWRVAELYGGIGGQMLPDGSTAYIINSYRHELERLKKDKRLQVQKVEKRKGHSEDRDSENSSSFR